eukprot:6382979-Ditylum_brightwellii.AAC.1
MEAHMDKTLSKMVSESRKMMKEETLEIRSMFSSVMENKTTSMSTLSGNSSHQNNTSPAVNPKQQYESACISSAQQ